MRRLGLAVFVLVACEGTPAKDSSADASLVERYEQQLAERDALWVRSHARALQATMLEEAVPGRSSTERVSLTLKLADLLSTDGDGIKGVEVAVRTGESGTFVPLVATWVGPEGLERAVGDGAALVPADAREGLDALEHVVGFSGAGDQREVRLTLYYARRDVQRELRILREAAGLPTAP